MPKFWIASRCRRQARANGVILKVFQEPPRPTAVAITRTRDLSSLIRSPLTQMTKLFFNLKVIHSAGRLTASNRLLPESPWRCHAFFIFADPNRKQGFRILKPDLLDHPQLIQKLPSCAVILCRYKTKADDGTVNHPCLPPNSHGDYRATNTSLLTGKTPD